MSELAEGMVWFDHGVAPQTIPAAQGSSVIRDAPDGPNAPWERHLAKSYPTPESRAAFDHEVRKITERAKTANGTRPLGSPPGSVPPKPSRG